MLVFENAHTLRSSRHCRAFYKPVMAALPPVSGRFAKLNLGGIAAHFSFMQFMSEENPPKKHGSSVNRQLVDLFQFKGSSEPIEDEKRISSECGEVIFT